MLAYVCVRGWGCHFLCGACSHSVCACVCPQSIPIGMPIVPDIATHVALLEIFNNAQTSVDMAVYYFSLLGGVCLCVFVRGGSGGGCKLTCVVRA